MSNDANDANDSNDRNDLNKPNGQSLLTDDSVRTAGGWPLIER